MSFVNVIKAGKKKACNAPIIAQKELIDLRLKTRIFDKELIVKIGGNSAEVPRTPKIKFTTRCTSHKECKSPTEIPGRAWIPNVPVGGVTETDTLFNSA